MEKSGHSWSTVTSGRKVQGQPTERDRILLSIQEMFKGGVDGDVVYMVLQESEWKAEEAVEKLLQLSQGSSGGHPRQPHGLTMKSVAQTISNGNRTSGQSGQRNMNSNQGLQLDLKSRLPSVGNQDEPFADGVLPVLSPRTPGTAGAGDINFPNFPQDQTNNTSFRTALSALDSYANNTYSYGTGFSSEGGSLGGVWDFSSTTGGFNFNSSAIPNIPPPPINDPSVANYGDGHANPFSTLPGLNNFVIPTTSTNNTVSDSPQVYTLPTTSSTLLRPNSPRTSHNNVFSKTSYNSPNRLSSVSSGLPSPFTPLNNIPPDFSNVNSTAGQTPSRQSSSGSNDGPPQPLPVSSNDTSTQRLRKYNMSLNATERESLEKLIEEVIIGGVDQGFVDSEATSSEDETGDSKKVKKDSDSSGKEATKPKEGKLYGSQMKVAAKHMKNLPPRFARRIQAAQKHADANNSAADKKVTTPEDEKKPKQKKKAGGLLEGIDSYFDEDEGPVDQLSPRAGQDANISELFDGQTTPDALQNLMLGDLSALATPPLVPSPKMTSQDSSRTPNSQVIGNVNVLQQASSVMNCEDLERELISSAQTPKDSTGQFVQNQFTEPPQIHRLAGVPINKTPQVLHSEQYLSLSETDRQKLSGFSVNAPEFVPRSVTPTKFVTSQAQPITHVPPPPAPPPPVPAPHTIVASPAQIPISSAVTMPPVKLMEGRPAVAPAVSQAFQHPPPPPKVPINRNSPFHVPLGRMSPQLVPHVTAQGRHSPTHAYILPKPPAQVSVGATPSAAAAAQVHPAALQPAVPGMIPYQPPYAVAFPAPPPPPPPPGRYAHYAYTRSPYLPPGAPYPVTWSEKSPQVGEKVQGRSAGHKSASKEKHWMQGSAYQNVHAPVPAQSTRIAANFHPPPTVLSRGTKAKNESVKQQQHLVHNKHGAVLVAVAGSPIQLAMEKPVQKVDRLLREGKFVMVILRGLPGSGKSSMAREMKKDGIVLTTDDFFIAENGQYKFDVAKLGEAHEFNQKRAKLAVESKINPIIIDNTNTQQWEMKYYITLALKANYHIEILEPDTPWKFRPKECFKKNNHNVTLDHIQRMSERYEHNVTITSILKSSDKYRADLNESILGQNHNADEEALQSSKKNIRKRKRRKKRKPKGQKDLDGEKEEDKEEASSDEDESTPDREHQTQKEKTDTNPVAKESGTNVSTSKKSKENVGRSYKADKKEVECSTSVIKNAPSQPSEENISSGKNFISDAIDLINNNSSKTGLKPSCPKLDPTVNERKVVSEEQVPNKVENEKNERNFESSGDKMNKVDSSSSSSSSASEEGGISKTTLTPSRVATLKNCDASEEDNAISGTDSGGVSTPMQRRYSEIHLGEPAMLKEAIESSLKEVLSSAGSDSETQEELAAALRRKLFQRQVSETLISEIEEIIKEKILENIINDEVAAITENVSKESDAKNSNVLEKCVEQPEGKEKIGNSTEEAYWKCDGENKHDPYVISVKSSEVEPARLTWTGEPTERAWEQPAAQENKTINQGHTSGSDSEPRTQRGPRSPNKRKPDTTVKLDADVKEQLVSGDWQIPTFTSVNVCAETTNFQEKKEKTNVGTFTHPKDFSNIQRILNEKLKLTEEDGFIKMMDTRPRIISDGTSPLERPNTQVPMLDKSCSVEEEMVNPDGLSFLQKCFPSVDESDLQDVLTRCEGDLQWATNILLDSSLEYNKPVSSDKNYSTADAKNQTVKRSPTGESPGASGIVSSPPLLAVLCHSSLPPATELSSNNVQQTFYHGSVQRLKSIEEFKRQHSIPSESYDKGAEVVVDRQPDLSMVNPCSPGGTLKDDVFETLFSQKSTKKFIPPTFKRIASLGPSPEDARSNADAEPSVSPAGQDEIDGKPVEPNATAAVSASIVTPIDEVIEGELKEVTTDFDVSLELPHALAKQLIKMFGPVAFHISPESLSQEDLTIHLNRGMAKRLHHCWAATLQEKFAKEERSIQSMIEQDEELAKRLQEEENNRHMRQLTSSRNPAAAGASGRACATPPRPPSLVGVNGNGNSPSLQHIMDEEAAIEASKQTYLQEYHSDAAGTEVTIATRLKRQKLQEIFPEIDTATLEEIFQSNGYLLGATVSAINAFLGKVEPARDVMTDEALAAYEERLIRQAQEESLRLHERQVAAVTCADEEDVEEYQTMDDPGYQDFRAETSIHYQLRKECFQKAQEAFRRGLRQVAAFYSQQGHLHTVKLKEANRRAAAKIIELRNEEISDTNKVDLHGLHVDEALEVLAKLLCRKEQELKLRKDKRKHWLFVVTGRGTHSQGGVARIKPVIFDYLNRNKYTFTEIHAGMLKVQLKIRD